MMTGEGATKSDTCFTLLTAFHQTLPAEEKDLVALATAFRQAADREDSNRYLVSEPVQRLREGRLEGTEIRAVLRAPGRLDRARDLQLLVDLRLLERDQPAARSRGR